MRTALTILVAGLLACSFFTYAGAQGAKFGMGVELQNQPAIVHLDVTDGIDLNMSSGASNLTPMILFSIQATPAVFIEPAFGFHRLSGKEEITGGTSTPTYEWVGSDINFGVGLIYALKPDVAVSPMIHPLFGIHMVKATYEETGTAEPGKAEVSTTAFQVGLGVGGLVNVKETVYLTAEARLMFTKVGDLEVTIPGFTDNSDTSESMFDTDMVIGLRFLF